MSRSRREKMNNLNSILIEGDLVGDPALRHTPKGTAVCNLTVACNRYYRNGNSFDKEVSFFKVEVWDKLAETVYGKGRKGRGVRVVGRLRQDRWADEDGKPHDRIMIVAEYVEMRPEFNSNTEHEGALNLDNEDEPVDIEENVCETVEA
jgi:single-strand DNA-binding protein